MVAHANTEHGSWDNNQQSPELLNNNKFKFILLLFSPKMQKLAEDGRSDAEFQVKLNC
jgi:hypothetical protein